MSILVLGTVALDTVKTPFGRRKDMLGGSAVHFAMSGRLFTRVNLVAVIGEDFPERHIGFLRKKGVVLDSLVRAGGSTFKWSGEYRGDLNTAVTLKTELGVLASFAPQVSPVQRRIKNVFLANVDPDIQRYLLGRMHSPGLVGLDSMNYWIQTKRGSLDKALKSVHIFVANDQEARDLSGETHLVKAARYLRSRGPRMILIKKGEHGVMFYSDAFIASLPAYPTARVIDPTGAGDTFAGGFMGYLAKTARVDQAAVKKALAYGTAAASLNVEGFGVDRTSLLTLRGLEKRLAAFKKIVLF